MARSILIEGEGDYMAAHAHFAIGQSLCLLGNPEQAGEAHEHLSLASELLAAYGDLELTIQAADWSAWAAYLRNDPAAAEMGESALSRYRELRSPDPDIVVRMLDHLGAYLRQASDYERSLSCYEEALQLLHESGPVLDLSRLARIYHGMALCFWELGRTREATERAEIAVSMYRAECDRRPPEQQIPLARAENDLGVMLMRQGQYARAEDFVMAAMMRFDRAGVLRIKCGLVSSLAELDQLQGRLDKAVEVAQALVGLGEQHGLIALLPDLDRRLGRIHADRGDRRGVDAAFRRAIELLGNAGLEQGLHECHAAYDESLAKCIDRASGSNRSGTGSDS
jgi:tetratricopeptide (TPR) repeat protein